MPSRVRIRLTTDGRRIYDTKAVISLQQMYARSLAKGFSTAIPVLPEVKWRKAVMLYQNIKAYIHHYDPGMRLLVLRERRGERSRIPTQNVPKKPKAVRAETLTYFERPRQQWAAVPVPQAIDGPGWNPLEPIQTIRVAQGRAENAVAGVQNFRWNFDNDPNR